MATQHTLAGPEPIILAPGEGTHLEFLNNLATVKVAAGEHGSMSVVEFLAPEGFGPPMHNHLEEDELFIVLEGTIALHTGGDRFEARAGSYAMLPHAVPHTFQVLTQTARIINVTSSNSTAPRFDRMVAGLGKPTDRLTVPEPTDIDPARVAQVCHDHGIEIVGPPPAPPI